MKLDKTFKKINSLSHYMGSSLKNGFKDNDYFNEKIYLEKYPEVEYYEHSPFIHYIKHGIDEDRNDKYGQIEEKVFLEQKKIILESNLFDETYYLEKYPELVESKWGALDHWIYFGFRDTWRNPNPIFSNEFYTHKYLSGEDINPLVHYINIGQNKGFKRNPFDITKLNYNDSQMNSILNALNTKKLVIVPIFDFSNVVEEYLYSLLKYTNCDFEILFIVNEEIIELFNEYLNNWDDFTSFKVIQSNKDNILNLINENVSNANCDVVILNSYSEVSYNWLNNLTIKAYSDDKIGFVTPLSNLFYKISPEYLIKKENSQIYTPKGINVIVNKSNENINLKFSIFDGFCIFIKKDAINDFNLDMESIFYSSPLAICAFNFNSNNKWDSIVDDSTYIYHNKEFFENNFEYISSFKIQKRLENNINHFLKSSKVQNLNSNFEIAVDSFNNHELSNRILYIVDEKYIKFTEDLTKSTDEIFDCYYLTFINSEIKLYKNLCEVVKWDIDYHNIKNILFNILLSINPNIIQFNNLGENFNVLKDLLEYLNIPYLSNYSNEDINISSKFKGLINLLENKLNDTIKILIPGDISDFDDVYVGRLLDLTKNSDFIELHFLGNVPTNLSNFGINHGDFNKNNLDSLINDIKPDFIGIFGLFYDMFDIIKVSAKNKIPILTYNEELFRGFVEENNGIYFVNCEDLSNSILEAYTFDNYYDTISEYYFNDLELSKEITKYNHEFMKLYVDLIPNSQKIIIPQLNMDITEKEPEFYDFDDFLANSYINPVIKAPFIEEEKRCFAVMDNIGKYLRNNLTSISERPLVSIIMPVYNRLNLIPMAIDSVLNQTYENIELIIVDDGSTDGTVEYLESINNKKINVFIQEENKGPSHARNVGLENAKGEYVAYLDSDNKWDSKYIETMIGAFIELPEADALYCGQLLFDDFEESPHTVRFGSFNKSLLHNRNYIDLNCFIHKRDIYQEFGGFDENLERLVDWDFILKISNFYKIFSVPVLLSLYYTGNDDSRITNTISLSNEKSLAYRNYVKEIQDKNKINSSALNYKLNHKVNIVIPNFESLYDLQICINTILSFNLDNLKIIIVDNNSNDSVKFYLKYLESEGIISLIQNNVNYGFTHAVNQGIEISDKDADILILNNDSILTNGAIEAMQNAAYSLEDCGLIVPQQVLPGGTKTINLHVPFAYPWSDIDVNPSKIHKNIMNMPLFHNSEVLELNFAPFFCVYIKRNVLDESPGLDAELGRHYRSDRIFSYYVRHVMKLKIYHVSNAIVYHKLQKATDKLRENKDDFDIMFVKNRWNEELAEELGFNQAIWDFD